MISALIASCRLIVLQLGIKGWRQLTKKLTDVGADSGFSVTRLPRQDKDFTVVSFWNPPTKWPNCKKIDFLRFPLGIFLMSDDLYSYLFRWHYRLYTSVRIQWTTSCRNLGEYKSVVKTFGWGNMGQMWFPIPRCDMSYTRLVHLMHVSRCKATNRGFHTHIVHRFP